MSDINSIHIRVKSDSLVSKANEADKSLADLRKKLETLESVMKRTSGYWTGEAGEKHRNLYNTQKQKTDDVLRRWVEYPKKLREMAGVYETTENFNVQMTEQLSGDVIE